MEQALIRTPIALFVMTVVTSGLVALCFPPTTWLVLPLLAIVLAYSLFASFFATRYTTYHEGLKWLLTLNFFLFIAAMTQTALDPWLPQAVRIAVIITYFVLLTITYLICYHKERRRSWSEFDKTLSNPALVIEKGKVRRIVRTGESGKKTSQTNAVASIGAALGIAMPGLVGALFGATGKTLLLMIVVAAFMVSPLFLLRYFVTYGIGIREVRKAERQRNQRFEFDNVAALQEARRTIFVARLLNPRLRYRD
ncbi:hypothetical protein WJ542_28830 [Paraburkholderia sp. B3]|uniref:hypothetical protein n=1 Tax=Paraburkholderia sp. B3 TaxID=3134791 RepID=UPI003982040F